MKYINIPDTDLIISHVAASFGPKDGDMDEKESFRLIDTYADKGGTFLDVANVYGRSLPGNLPRNEIWLGRYFKERQNRHKFVLDSKGKRIELKRDSKDDPFDLSQLPDQIGIYNIENPYGLQPVGDTCFALTESSGEATADRNGSGRLIQGALEQSSVDLSDEMVNVIQAQRAFQLNAKMVQTADELEQVINNLR